MTTIIAASHNNKSTNGTTRNSHNPPSIEAPLVVHSKKRRIDAADDNANDNRTMTKFPTGTSGNLNTSLLTDSNSTAKIQFQTVHFNILRALYQDNNSEMDFDTDDPSLLNRKDDDLMKDTKQQRSSSQQQTHSSTNIRGDGTPIDLNHTTIWDHIQSFMMHHRESLLHIQHRIERASHLHEAALEYCHTMATTADAPAAATAAAAAGTATTNDSFRIIANIIGSQSKMIQAQKQVPSVLLPLREEVTKRIETLQARYTKLCQQQSSMANNYFVNAYKPQEGEDDEHTTTTTVSKGFRPSSTIRNDPSNRTELQYKIQLWSLLLHDLTEVLRN